MSESDSGILHTILASLGAAGLTVGGAAFGWAYRIHGRITKTETIQGIKVEDIQGIQKSLTDLINRVAHLEGMMEAHRDCCNLDK